MRARKKKPSQGKRRSKPDWAETNGRMGTGFIGKLGPDVNKYRRLSRLF
jgi:hypothetical protein